MIDNSDDLIDSRDVIARIAELRDERDSLQEDLESVMEDSVHEDPFNDPAVQRAREARDEWAGYHEDELASLEKLQEEAEGYSYWLHGAQLIRDSYFETYARQTAEDIGGIDLDQWPATCIDWERAGRELQMDYTAVEFDGVTYWVQS